MMSAAYIHIKEPQNSPTVYNKVMQPIQSQHRHNTRLATRLNFIAPKFQSNFKRQSFSYAIVRIWNSIPYPIKINKTKAGFIDALKRYLSELSD